MRVNRGGGAGPFRRPPAVARGKILNQLHLLIALTYTVIAGGVAFAAPIGMNEVDVMQAAVLGGLFWVAALLMHEIFVRLRGQTSLAAEIASQRDAYAHLLEELNGARGQVRLIQEALEAAAHKRHSASARDFKEVADEVRVLKGLVEQVTGRESVPAGPSLKAVASEAPVTTAVEAAEGHAPPQVATNLDDGQVLEVVRDGLKADRVDLYLQPTVELPQRKRRFFECYSRIRAEEGEMVVPDQYIAMAEREGLISAIDNMLLFRCVQLIRKTRQRRYRVGFFCNISHHTLVDTTFFPEFVRFMTANEELSSSLVFEFAQADLADQDMPVIEELDRLASLGFRYSIDQVGDFAIRPAKLAARHVGFVKLDAEATLTKIREEEFDLGAFRRSLEARDIEVIVEKVESEHDLVELLDFGIGYGQGFLFGEPRLSREP